MNINHKKHISYEKKYQCTYYCPSCYSFGPRAKLCDKASTDGSEFPRFILLYDIDTTPTGHDGEALTRVISGGKLREDRLIFGGDTNINSMVNSTKPDIHINSLVGIQCFANPFIRIRDFPQCDIPMPHSMSHLRCVT